MHLCNRIFLLLGHVGVVNWRRAQRNFPGIPCSNAAFAKCSLTASRTPPTSVPAKHTASACSNVAPIPSLVLLPSKYVAGSPTAEEMSLPFAMSFLMPSRAQRKGRLKCFVSLRAFLASAVFLLVPFLMVLRADPGKVAPADDDDDDEEDAGMRAT